MCCRDGATSGPGELPFPRRVCLHVAQFELEGNAWRRVFLNTDREEDRQPSRQELLTEVSYEQVSGGQG